MKISLNYLKKFIDFDLPPINELADVIGSRLGALEDLPVNLSDIYKDVVIVKVVSCTPIPDTDHLNLCLVDDGGKVTTVDRNSDGLVTVVCGAPNVSNNQMAAWLPPGSIVPSTYFKDQLKLEAREIRGQLSNGMLASSKELGLSDDHEGILVVEGSAKPGDSFSKTYDLDDYLIDIENKMFTHRPDCFGLLGVAREVSGILNHQFKSPSWYTDQPRLDTGSSIDIKIQNEIPALVPRFSLVVIDNIEIKPSPLHIQSYLTRMGIRPINNIVDLTNIIMLETAQPLHAYDYHKLQKLAGNNPTIIVRQPKPDEKLKLLSGKEVKPTPETICIALKDQIIGLGGVMGGESTEVDENTTAIVLEAATFDMYAIKRTSMELGVFSEAVTRFTKGQSPLQTTRVLNYTLTKLNELLPECKVLSNIDNVHVSDEVIKRDSLYPAITIKTSFINDRLGTNLSNEQIAALLQNVECHVDIKTDELVINAPFWRTDLEIREDIVEEVGRLYGYDNISPKALNRTVRATEKNLALESKSTLRNLLSSAGANELLTYSFISKKLVENVNQSVDKAYEIANSISPELNYYRLSVLPSLLFKVHMNIKAGFDEFALFEIGTYHASNLFKQDAEPDEFSSLALVYSSKKAQNSAAYFKAKDFLSFVLEKLNVSDVSLVPLSKIQKLEDNLVELAKPFNSNRSAVVMLGDKQYGVVGEFSSSVLSNLKLPAYSAGFEILTELFLESKLDDVYAPMSKYPSVKQDITLKVPDGPSYADVYSHISEQLKSLTNKSTSFILKPVSIFEPKDAAGTKNYTFHVTITDQDRTLKDQDVNELLDKLAATAKEKLGATRV